MSWNIKEFDECSMELFPIIRFIIMAATAMTAVPCAMVVFM